MYSIYYTYLSIFKLNIEMVYFIAILYSMTIQKGSKLNHLQHLLSEGLLVDAGWLERKGYSRALRSQYVSAGWLEQVARGVYRRPGGKLKWQQLVISLQTLLEIPVTVGGRTALELQGFAHYLPLGSVDEVHLYHDKPLPGWVSKLKLDSQLVSHNAKKLFNEQPIARGLTSLSCNLKHETTESNDAVHNSGLTQQSWGQWDWPLTLSTPERAILELLEDVPQRETFEQADKLIEGLRTLSPRRLQKLLEDCRSVKVKRLFLWFANRHKFRWFNRINQDRIDLGKGKRMLAKKGKLDPVYLITVPEKLYAGA